MARPLTSSSAGTRSARSAFNPVQWASRSGIHYGWVVVGITFLIAMASSGTRSVAGVMIQPLEQEFGWTRGQISLALSMSLLAWGAGAPLSGKIIEKKGLYFTVAIFLTLTAISMALMLTVRSLPRLYIVWGLLAGFGVGGIGTPMSATVANLWFDERRGLVTGILSGAASAGQLVFIPLLVQVTSASGWRTSMVLLAVLTGVIVLPLALFLMRSSPQSMGMSAFGAKAATVASTAGDRITSFGEALRTKDMWLLMITFFVCGFTTIGFVGQHFIPHAVEHGFSTNQAAGILSIIGAMNVVGTITSGWLCDRYSPRKLLAGYYFMRALSLLWLPFITTVPFMSAFAILFGLDYIATVPPTVLLTAERYGRRSVPSLFGWITCMHMVGAAVAAAFAGQIHDLAGDYSIAIYVSGVLGLAAAGMAFNINLRRRSLDAPVAV